MPYNSGNQIHPVPLGEDIEARTEGRKLSLGRKVEAVFFLTAPLSNWQGVKPKSGLPRTN